MGVHSTTPFLQHVAWAGFAALAMSCAMACATAIPTYSGASTTPKKRSDLMLGGAARIPVGSLRDFGPADSRYRETAETGGIVPVAAFRHGLTRHRDLGVMVAGTNVRLEVRGETGVREGSTRPAWIWAAAAYGGYVPDRDGDGGGGRFGIDVPVVYGIDFGGLYDVWIGPRLGAQMVVGDFEFEDGRTEAATAGALSLGGVVGVAAGFRRVHAMLEVTVAYEHWFGSHGDQSLRRGGFVVTPGFALRLRL